jgi:hypothetical protein
MKVRILEAMAGKGFVYQKGKVYDLPPGEAKSYIRSGLAEAVKEEKPKQRKVTVQQVKKTAKRPVK